MDTHTVYEEEADQVPPRYGERQSRKPAPPQQLPARQPQRGTRAASLPGQRGKDSPAQRRGQPEPQTWRGGKRGGLPKVL